MLKPDRKTDLSEIRMRVNVFRRDVWLFYVVDIAPE
jgi:hypothetical protein